MRSSSLLAVFTVALLAIALPATPVRGSVLRHQVGKKCPSYDDMWASANSYVNPTGLFSVGKKWACLKALAQKEYSTETLEFYEKVIEFKADPTRPKGFQILNMFITEMSAQQVNIDGKTRKNIV